MARSTRPLGVYPTQKRSADTRPVKQVRRSVSPVGGRRQVRSPYGQPPVLVRNETSALPIDRRRRKAARRRYDVALGSNGAELRLPSLPQLRFSWRLLSLLLVAALAGGIYAIWTAPEFQVQSIEVQGLARLTATDINTVVGIENQSVFSISPEGIKQDLLAAFPEIAAVSVEVDLPASVVVTIEERQPVLALQAGGEQVWVDEQGIGFPARGDTGPLPTVLVNELPAIEGTESPVVYDAKMIQAILMVTPFVPSGEALVMDGDHGLGWTDERGWQAFFGFNLDDPAEIEMKLGVYDALVERLEDDGIWPRMISVEFLHAPYYRLE